MASSSFQISGDIFLESGNVLKNPVVAYQTWGQLNERKDNVVWVFHALTANDDVYSWWKGMFGKDGCFKPEEDFVICANVLGSCYGSTGPTSLNPESGTPYFHQFPDITIRDQVGLHIQLAEELGIKRIKLAIGGSLGGYQALEWAVMDPDRIVNLVLVATSAKQSPWAAAFNETQRSTIALDPTWRQKSEEAGLGGMAVARGIALLSYRNQEAYNTTQADETENLLFPKRVASYQHYQGEKLANRFNAFSYWAMSRAMDSMDLGRGRGGLVRALEQISARTLVLSLENDLLFPLEDQLTLVEHIPGASHSIVSSSFGHDGFLIETKSLSQLINRFVRSNKKKSATVININPLNTMKSLRTETQTPVILIGLGTVGTSFYKRLAQREDVFLAGIAVKQFGKSRNVPEELLTGDAFSLMDLYPNAVVVELTDDPEAALEYGRYALQRGQAFISANKKMLAEGIQELSALELRYGGKLLYEAAVGGAIPILRSLSSYFRTEEIRTISGIVNGSTNYILSQMYDRGWSYEQALEEAQKLGFAESDPTLDVEGFDAAYKLVILTWLAFGEHITIDEIARTGISEISRELVEQTRATGQKIKLLAQVAKVDDQLSLSVKPTLLDPDHTLYSVDQEQNAIHIEGKYSGPTTLKGLGAGGDPTASAVLADLDFILEQRQPQQTAIKTLVVS